MLKKRTRSVNTQNRVPHVGYCTLINLLLQTIDSNQQSSEKIYKPQKGHQISQCVHHDQQKYDTNFFSFDKHFP